MMFHVHYSVTSTDSEAGTVTGPKTSTGNPSGSNQAELTRLHYIYDAWNRLTYVKNDSGLNRHTAEGQIQVTVRPTASTGFTGGSSHWRHEQVNLPPGQGAVARFDQGALLAPDAYKYRNFTPTIPTAEDSPTHVFGPSSPPQPRPTASSTAATSSTPRPTTTTPATATSSRPWGEWTQRDFAGYVEGANLYEYVGSMPTQQIDPLGLARAWGSG